MKGRRVAAPFLALVLLFDACPASAESGDNLGSRIVRGIVGLFSRETDSERAQKAWLLVDAKTQGCVAAKLDRQPSAMIDEGIGPDDERIAPSIAACRREAEEAKAKEAQDAQVNSERKARKKRKTVPDPNRHSLPAQAGPPPESPAKPGKLRLGMTREQVVAVQGLPQRKDAVPPDYEVWHFAFGDVAFTNGRVTYIGR